MISNIIVLWYDMILYRLSCDIHTHTLQVVEQIARSNSNSNSNSNSI